MAAQSTLPTSPARAGYAPSPEPPSISLPDGLHGLTTAEVTERIARGQSNAFQARVGRTYWDIVRDNILNLFNIVLFSLLLVVLLFGDYATVLFAGFSVVFNSLLGMVQEINAKRKLDQLAALAAPEVRVLRDGAITRVKVEEIVLDDVLPIEPGDRIVVDGRILASDALEIDESQLTGESDAVLKDADSPISSGSFCLAGSGWMVATRVGKDSTVNRLTEIAKAYKHVRTPTQERIALILQIGVVIMAVCTPMIFIAGLVARFSISLETFRSAVVFVASVVPQGLLLTVTLALTLGAVIISRRQTLVQRVNAIESMAHVDIFCFDKTGTLTKNQLAVMDVIALAEDAETITAKLKTYIDNLAHKNRTALALARYLDGVRSPAAFSTKLREVPFSSARKWGAVVFPAETLILGAPERVLPPQAVEAQTQALDLARQGLRVLAFARTAAPVENGALPPEREALGLIVLHDQVRENISETLAEFSAQGVALKIISGDNAETVREIAREAGLTVHMAYTGAELEAMAESEFAAAVREADLFARVEPDTKRKIIASLKAQGFYVAMTGDGVNDVPALKEAHLAIAMNDGAQISKDLADIVLLNNALTTLPRAFQEGRTITQTIFASCRIFLVKTLYSILFFVLVGFMMMPFPISPIQISWVTFGVINAPAILIAFRVLKPVPLRAFRRDVLDYVVSAGVIAGIAMSLLYGVIYLNSGRDRIEARSAMVIFLTLYGLLVYLNTHGISLFEPATWRSNPRAVGIGLVLAAGTFLGPFLLPRWLEFVPPTLLEWTLIAAVFALSALLLHLAMRSRVIAERLWKLTSP